MNAQLQPVAERPRLGFLGVGWIGRQRMQVLAESGVATVAAVADINRDAAAAAAADIDGAGVVDAEALFDRGDLDGVVIATPSGAHAAQAVAALERGLAVFCQKPLARTAEETARVLAAARAADRLVDADFSYRHLAGVARLRELVRGGALGEVHAIDLTFHNAYGPDKPWFYRFEQSGGGCVMDLGIHLVDLAHWICGGGAHAMAVRLYAGGERLRPPLDTVEDYASAQWELDSGACVRLTCSWCLHAGCDAEIGAAFYGTRGGAAVRNVAGSFYDFTVDHFDGTARQRLAQPPDAWGGRALVDWARRLAADRRYDREAGYLLDVARTVDAIYGR
ncbi:Gfo/Idh/MocA family protein [Luteimonas suaedae]|uniref:Gfo/Idh/MocA family protein n=1 Tax=Luteimonas suaedae TaxID=2605430 RepID=UPI002103A44E|nr:Gfo/Idh/MocA family oxidoreductase [Luteimonas suaedae]